MLRALFVLILVFVANSAWAQSNKFETIAPYALIMDFETGQILYEKDARRPVPPASMTKIMTAEIVFEQIRKGNLTMDTEFIVSEDAWRRGGFKSGSSTMALAPKSSVRVEDLLRGVIIQSGNDACIVLAEGIAGSESAFADMMNQHAKDIGLKASTFRNATGWPHPEHKISLHDLGQLARRAIMDYPEYYKMYAEDEFTWNGVTQPNRNPLLGRFEGADGLKTGSTTEAGYGLVGSAIRGDKRRIIVVNGLESKSQRRSESLRLMRAAFENFRTYKLYEAGALVGKADVFMGKVPTVNLVTEDAVIIGLERSLRSNMSVEIRVKQEVPAPIAKGDHIADLVIKTPNMPEKTLPLVAESDVKRKSAFGRAMGALVRLIQG